MERPDWVGTPTDFLCHAWQYNFKDFVSALQCEAEERDRHRQKQGLQPIAHERLYWNDIFVENQNFRDKPEGYFQHVFRDAIHSIGRTVLILMPLKDPVPLKRAWCVWEMFCSIQGPNVELCIALPPSERVELERMLRQEYKNIIKILTNVHVEMSEASHVSDRDMIHWIVEEQCEGGFNGVNGVICEGLRGWLASTALRLVSDIVEGEEAEEDLLLMNSVGLMLRDQGRLEEAEVLYRRGLAGYERVLGVDDPSTLISVNNLGMLLQNQGKLEEAETLLQRALEATERVLGVNHLLTLISVNNFAELLKDQGKLEEAEPLYRRALEGRERVLGVDHPDTLFSVSSLGGLLQNQGKLEEAEVLSRRALEVRERVLGVDHPDTLISVNNVAGLLRAQGKLEEAEPLYHRVLEGSERVLGVDHPNTLTSVSNLGNLLQDQGRLEEAETLYQRALEGRERVLGVDHPSTLDTMYNLALLLEKKE